MAEHYTDSERAEGKIRGALSRLGADYPFHARVLEQFKLVARPEVKTLAVTVADDDVLLLHHPGFVLEVSAAELGGALLHALHHVVLGHVLADPADYPDAWARTLAEELTANEFVHEPLPAGAITLDGFPQLPPRESTARRYERLRRVRRRRPVEGPAGHRAGRGRTSEPSHLHTLDHHGSWAQARQDPARAQAAIRGIVQLAALEVGRDNIPPDLRDDPGHFGIGSEPGKGVHGIHGGARGCVNWRLVLHRYVGRILETRPTFTRPPRRFPNLLGILPAWRRQPARPKIMAVIDTSASISALLLQEISAELAALGRDFSVRVVECDSAIQRVYDYCPLEAVCGRGGTDFRPPLESAFLRRHRPDLVVYFTDGAGPAPAAPPRCPVLWCLLPGGQRPAQWGRVVHLEVP
jgi:predicted metal-dependent peptidase